MKFLAAVVTGCLLILAALAYRDEPAGRLPRGGRLDAIYFADENHGYLRQCCPRKPTTYETTDGGRSWKLTDTPVRGLRRGRVFVDSQKGWSLVEDAWPHTSIYSTNDGGKTWQFVLQSGKKESFYFDAIQATSESDIWALGYPSSYHTSDAGRTWETLNLTGISLSFVDPLHGWILSGSSRKTTDGGKTWSLLMIPHSTLPGVPEFELWDIYFLDKKRGWMVGGTTENFVPGGKQHGVLLSSTDGGESWTVATHFEDRFLWSVFFLNERIGWVAGLEGTFLKTTDGGKTWLDPATGQSAEVSHPNEANQPKE